MKVKAGDNRSRKTPQGTILDSIRYTSPGEYQQTVGVQTPSSASQHPESLC